MGGDLGEEVEDQGTRDDQGETKDGGEIEALPVVEPSNDGDQSRTHPGPDGVGHTNGKGLQGDREQEKAVP